MEIAGLVLGILSVIGAWIAWIPGFGHATVFVTVLLAITGIILSSIIMARSKRSNQPAGHALAGFILSITGLVISFAGLIYTVLSFNAAAAASLGF